MKQLFDVRQILYTSSGGYKAITNCALTHTASTEFSIKRIILVLIIFISFLHPLAE